MNTQSALASTFAHMAWADGRILQLLTTAELNDATREGLRLFAHLVAAERVWLLRLSGEGAEAPPIWPDWSLQQIAAVVADNARDYQQFVATLSATDVEWYVEYKNSQGVLFSTRIIDILTHVALHGSYHRGQITMTLRAGGIAPVNTDYITFVREA